MATIRTTLELVDNVSGRLAAVGSRVQALAERFEFLDEKISGVQARMTGLDLQVPEWKMQAPAIPELGGIEAPKLRAPEYTLESIKLPVLEAAEAGPPVFMQAETAAMQALPVAVKAPEFVLPEWELPTPVPEFAESRAAATVQPGPVQAGWPEVSYGFSGFGADGSGMLQGQIDAIGLQQERLVEVAETAASAAVNAVQQKMHADCGMEIGTQFAAGLARGIAGRIGAVVSAARSVASAAADAARAALDIHSPSRVAQRIGLYFGTGFASGIEDADAEVSGAAAWLSGIAYRELNEDIWNRLRLFTGMEHVSEKGNAGNGMRAVDMQRIRELAEREGIKTFTTAQLNIEFTANNTIDSKMDLDGVVSYLEEQVAEKLALAAEGVYI